MLKTLKSRVRVLETRSVPTLEARPGATPRQRGRALMGIRERWFRERPLCVACEKEGRVSAAVILDHVIPLWKGGRDDDTNRQGLCIEHSDAKTASEAAERARGGGVQSL